MNKGAARGGYKTAICEDCGGPVIRHVIRKVQVRRCMNCQLRYHARVYQVKKRAAL